MARPEHQPDNKKRWKVEAYVACGYTQEAIARELRLSVNTVKKHYANELANGAESANAKMAKKVYDLGLGGNFKAAQFWLKCRAKWVEKHDAPKDNGKKTLADLVAQFTEDQVEGKPSAER